jgi:hypothetical protein
VNFRLNFVWNGLSWEVGCSFLVWSKVAEAKEMIMGSGIHGDRGWFGLELLGPVSAGF